MQSSTESVSQWLCQLKGGDPAAAQKLWERYFQSLVELAHARLHGRRQGAADEEDIALSAFDSFCRGAAQGRFPRLEDRDNLWRLLVTITGRKVAHLVRDQQRQKRAGPTHGAARSQGAPVLLEDVVGREPSPEFAAQMADEYRRLLGGLPEPELRAIAVLKMEGYTTEEIAARLGRAPRTIERKVQRIRGLWQQEVSACAPNP